MNELNFKKITLANKLKIIAFYKDKKVKQKTFYRKIKPNKDYNLMLPIKKSEEVDKLEIYLNDKYYGYYGEVLFEEKGYLMLTFRINMRQIKERA